MYAKGTGSPCPLPAPGGCYKHKSDRPARQLQLQYMLENPMPVSHPCCASRDKVQIKPGHAKYRRAGRFQLAGLVVQVMVPNIVGHLPLCNSRHLYDKCTGILDKPACARTFIEHDSPLGRRKIKNAALRCRHDIPHAVKSGRHQGCWAVIDQPLGFFQRNGFDILFHDASCKQ